MHLARSLDDYSMASPYIIGLWLVTVALQAAVICRMVTRLTRAYPMFLLWMGADLLYQVVMFTIYVSPSPVSGDIYTRLWGLFEIALSVGALAACYECVRRVRKHQLETILLATLISASIAWLVSTALISPQHYSSGLEPAIRLKSFIDLVMFCVIVLLIDTKYDRMHTRYSWALAGYFGAMSAANFLSIHQMSQSGHARLAELLTTIVPGLFFIALLFILWRSRNAQSVVQLEN